MFGVSVYAQLARELRRMEIEEYRQKIAKRELLKSLKRKSFFTKILSVKPSISFQKMNYKNWKKNWSDYV